ncbi:OmpA family protein [Sphingomonas profundi]|uniref:OmpA family protein n=1 Tax=Alterirhizorhabdus profundi TaxID=2681549 RepID=UPI0012E72906|nr:OmpA family protein [Sphingomonas profundi]
MRTVGGLLLAAIALGGCARSTVLLLPGENGAPAGSVAVLDETSGNDRAVLADANEQASLAPGAAKARRLKEAAIARRDRRLVEDLPPPPRTFILNFMTDSTRLTAESEPVLKELFGEVRRRDGVDVVVIGHADRAGTEAFNDTLSLQRANDIRDQLIARGLDPASTRAVGRGERDMLVETADGVASRANRRVEVVVR